MAYRWILGDAPYSLPMDCRVAIYGDHNGAKLSEISAMDRQLHTANFRQSFQTTNGGIAGVGFLS